MPNLFLFFATLSGMFTTSRYWKGLCVGHGANNRSHIANSLGEGEIDHRRVDRLQKLFENIFSFFRYVPKRTDQL